MDRTRAAALMTFLLVACSNTGSKEPARIEATGPPEVRPDVIAEHAAQFDDEVPVRIAGSQQEQIASTYLLGHLQQAGYVVRLEAVPVADLVRSTDVIALAPSSGDDPARLVAVGYDTDRSPSATGAALGLFLELARAVKVGDPDHDVSFAALGAEHARFGGGKLGSRRLVNLLLDNGAEPAVIVLEHIAFDESLTVSGDDADQLESIAEALGVEVEMGAPSRDSAFARAGMPTTTISGDPDHVGRVLLEFLTHSA